MTLKVQRIVLWILWSLVSIPAFAVEEPDPVERVERIVWDKQPIPITLVTGAEQLVSFPDEVRVGVPVEIQSSLRTQSSGGTVYWLAQTPFETQRIQVQDLATGEIVLIDLKAVGKDPKVRSIPIEVVIQDRTRPQLGGGSGQSAGVQPDPIDYVSLTRHAARQLYAPKRILAEAPAGIYRAAVPHGRVESLARGLPVEFLPVAAWTGGGLYVTALRVRNLGSEFLILDPRRLRGAWLAATFQHVRLYPAGEEADTTALYLVSDRPFWEAL